MPKSQEHREFGELSVHEQILDVQDLWDRIAAGGNDVELTDAQRTEIERRLREHERKPGEYTSWDELRRRLERTD